ncbi:MAG TPA: hypothetical protein VFP65_21590 [Anaeromyxobacteraceae bacterium]|nr:hypothetical protein [Anaeromyxobacteraceae bacterium]
MITAPFVNVTTLLAGIDPAHLDAALVDARAAVTALLADVPAPGADRRKVIGSGKDGHRATGRDARAA